MNAKVTKRGLSVKPAEPACGVCSTNSATSAPRFRYDLISKYYDIFKAGKHDDTAFYLELAHQTGGPVLALGCGTGRLLVEFAIAGLAVVGVDFSKGMLDVAARKLAKLPSEIRDRTRLEYGDMSKAEVDGNFGLAVIAYDAIYQLPSDEARQ